MMMNKKLNKKRNIHQDIEETHWNKSLLLKVHQLFCRCHYIVTKRQTEVPYIFHTVNELNCDVGNTVNCQKPIIR